MLVVFNPDIAAIFWAGTSCRLALEDTCFRMSPLHSFPGLCHMHSETSPELFRSGPELADSWESRLDVIMRLICGFFPTKHLRELFCDSPLSFPRNLSYVVFLSIFEFRATLLLGCSSQLSLFNAASFLLFLKFADIYGKSVRQWLIIDCFSLEGKIKLLFRSQGLIRCLEKTVLGVIVSITEW